MLFRRNGGSKMLEAGTPRLSAKKVCIPRGGARKLRRVTLPARWQAAPPAQRIEECCALVGAQQAKGGADQTGLAQHFGPLRRPDAGKMPRGDAGILPGGGKLIFGTGGNSPLQHDGNHIWQGNGLCI